MRGVAKIAEQVIMPAEIANVMRRAFSNLRNGRSGPAIVEIPTDIWNEEIGDLDYTPVSTCASTVPIRPMCARLPRRSWRRSGR